MPHITKKLSSALCTIELLTSAEKQENSVRAQNSLHLTPVRYQQREMSFFKTCTAFQTKKSKVLWQAWKPRPSSVICVLENFYCNRTLMRGEEALIAISGCIRHRICFAILLWTPIILHCELKCQMSAVRMSVCRDFVLTDDFNSEFFSQSQETWA